MEGNDNETQEEDYENEHGRNMKKLKRGVGRGGLCLKVVRTMWCCELSLINHLPTLGAALKCEFCLPYYFLSFIFEPRFLDPNRVIQNQRINTACA
jgi:hypothetical protein